MGKIRMKKIFVAACAICFVCWTGGIAAASSPLELGFDTRKNLLDLIPETISVLKYEMQSNQIWDNNIITCPPYPKPWPSPSPFPKPIPQPYPCPPVPRPWPWPCPLPIVPIDYFSRTEQGFEYCRLGYLNNRKEDINGTEAIECRIGDGYNIFGAFFVGR